MRSTPFAYGETTMWKGVLFVRKDEGKRGNPAQMVLGVVVGSAVAIAAELVVLLVGAAAISGGMLRENAQLQLVALGCVLGALLGGLICACRWPARKLLGGLAVGAVNYLLLWVVSVARGGGQILAMGSLVVLACCVCGGALAGLMCLKVRKKKPSNLRRGRT